MIPTIEQIRQLASKCHPGWEFRAVMDYETYRQGELVRVTGLLFDPGISFDTTASDIENAKWIVWGLDQLGNDLALDLLLHETTLVFCDMRVFAEGETVAQAVFWALYKALGCKS